MPYDIEARVLGLKKEGTRLTAETTADIWAAINPETEMNYALKLIEDMAQRGTPVSFAPIGGRKEVTGKVVLPVRPQNIGEFWNMFMGAPSSAEQTAFVITGASNDKIDFTEDGGAAQVATLTAGSYTSTTLAAEVKTQLETANGTAATYTVTYSTSTKKFTITKNSGVFVIKWSTGTNTATSARTVLGFTNADTASAIAATSDSTSQFAYKHTFSVPTTTQLPTYTVFLDRSMNVLKYNGCAAKSISLSSPVDGAIQMEAEILGLTEATGLMGSPVFTESAMLAFNHANVYVAGALSTNVKSWSLKLENGAYAKFVQNQSQDASDVLRAGKFKASGSMLVIFESVTERAKFLANTAVALRFLIEGATINGTQKYTLDVNAYQAHYKAFPYGADQNILAAQVEWEGHYSVADTKMVQVDLTNIKTAY